LSTETGHLPCEQNPGLWYSPDPVDIQRAKQTCRSCLRRELCLSETLETEDLLGMQLVGVHGGLTPAERNQLKA
jgi:predicted RecB family nuclease